MIELKKLTKIYNTNGASAVGLKDVSLTLNKGEFIGIVGPSGSGKTTLLNVVSGMDSYEEGELFLFSKETSSYTPEDFEIYRRNNVAFIFQNYQLIDSYSALDNVVVELLFKGVKYRDAIIEAKEILKKVGMSHREKNKTSKLSGGEKQRVVIARALASDCQILACDEPTGNLDSANSIEVIKLLKEISKDKLVLFVTHEEELLDDVATRIITIKDSCVESDVIKKEVDIVESSTLNDKKISFKTNFLIAFKNLFSTPKRTLLLLLLFMVSTFLIAITTTNDDFTNSSKYNEIYSNPTENRLIVYSDEDYKATKIINDSFIDKQIYLKYTDLDNIIVNYAYVSVFPDKLTYGKVLENKYEIILEVSRWYVDYIDYKLLEDDNCKITINDNEYTIVGIIESEGVNNFIYFYNDEVPYISVDYDLKEEDNTYVNDISIFYNDDKINFNTNIDFINTNTLLTIPNGYDVSKIDFKIGNNKIEINSTNFVYSDVKTIEINCAFIDDYLNDNIYRVSYFFENEKELEDAYKYFSNKELTVISPSEFEYVKDMFYYFDLFSSIMGVIMTGLLILASITILSSLSFIILKTTVKDFTIMRIIGLDKKDVYFVLLFQLIISLIISYILMLLLIFIISTTNFGKRIYFDELIVELLTFKSIFNTSFLLILCALFVSYKHHKKMFKSSASTNLRGGELL